MTGIDHKDIMQKYESGWEADQSNREDGLDDLRFLAGDQWDAQSRNEREFARRPVVTINRMGQFVRQITGDMRLNPVSINVIPVDDGDDEKAEVFQGIIRGIENASMAQNVYSSTFEAQAAIGIGNFRINTQYVKDSVFEQEITIQRIQNPFSVVWDPNSTKIDRSDAMFCFVTELMSKEAFERKFKTDAADDFPSGSYNSSQMYWRDGEFVRVAEFWYKKPYQRTLVLVETGETIDATGLSKSERAILGGISERTFEDFKVIQCMVSGSAILTEWKQWAGSHIPIVPAVGSEIPLDERVVRHGIIRWAKDPQRLYNYYRSSQAELIGQQPRAPFLLTPKMVKGYEDLWNKANTSPRPWLPFNPDSDVPGMRPDRIAPPQASPAMWQEALISQDDMKATTGIYDASLGAKSNETSGVAINARKEEGDVGSYQYPDNFKCAIKRAGEIMLDLIPKIYDTQRVLRIVGKEDETKTITVNKLVRGPNGVEQILNDLTVGRYDVRVVSGPAFSTMRQAARDGMLAAGQANPQLWVTHGDIMIEAMDWPLKEKFLERFKRTMPPELTATKEEIEAQAQMPQQPAPPPPPDPAVMEAERKAAFDKEKLAIEAAKVDIERVKVEADIEMSRDKLVTERLKYEADYDMKVDMHNQQQQAPQSVNISNDSTQIVEAMAQLAQMLAEQQKQGNEVLAASIIAAMSQPKTVTTPDGRTYEMKVN